MKTLAMILLLCFSANACAAFDMEVSVTLPMGALVPPQTAAPLDITVRNLGPDPAPAQPVWTGYYGGAPRTTISIAPTLETSPCHVAISSLSPRPGQPVPYLATIVPPPVLLAAGQSVTCRVELRTYFDSPDRVSQYFTTRVEPPDRNPDNDFTFLGIVVRNPPVTVPAHNAIALWLMALALLLPGVRCLRRRTD